MVSRIQTFQVVSNRSLYKAFRGYTSYVGNNVLGIMRESHGMWERRAPLSPAQVSQLLQSIPTREKKVIVQPCTRRIFTNEEYQAIPGVVVQEDLSEASLIIGVKSPSAENLIPDKSYMFFSHTIKAQPYSMPLLDSVLENNIRLFDYECITRDGKDDTPRLVAFGKYAGRAGMIDAFQGLGLRLLAEGYSTPFLHVTNTYMYTSLKDVQEGLKKVGNMITQKSLPESIAPIVFAFTGSGNVAQGAKEIFEMLPHEYITTAELPLLEGLIKSGRKSPNKLYGVQCTVNDLVKHKTKGDEVDKQDYYRHPHEYEPIFHKKVLPYTTMLVNGIYWENRFPRIITSDQLRELRATGNRKFKAVADVSCDIGGSVEFLHRPTTIEKPFFSFNPEKGSEDEKITSSGVLMLGVDNLPSELPRDASEHFGEKLLPLLPPILRSHGSTSQVTLHDLPPELIRACIASHGELMPKWGYISRLREQAQVLTNTSENKSKVAPKVYMKIELVGHLFDTGLINQVLDTLELDHDINFSIVNCEVRPNSTAGAQHSRILLQLTGDNSKKVEAVADKICKMVRTHRSAEGTAEILANDKNVKVLMPKRVLLFGAGRVALPIAKLFSKHDDVHLTVATEFEDQADMLIDCMNDPDRGLFHKFKFPEDNDRLPALIKQCDIVISLLPATMHVPIAEEAIRQRRHMVTASYVSPAMQALHEKAVQEGVIILNEVGLDPGIDHMVIMQAIENIKAKGGKVTELVSLCGGLPDPVAAENPLRYKFSWSPRGVLNASGNSAQYINEGQVVQVPGAELLKAAQPSNRFPTLRLEVLPNRDSLVYKDLYNVESAKTVCRGTLRYEGWSNVMYGLRQLGLFNDTAGNGQDRSIVDYIKDVFPNGVNDASLKGYLQDKGVTDIAEVAAAMKWLGLMEGAEASSVTEAKKARGKSAIDAFCKLLEGRLQYLPGEKDMVAMFHKIAGELPDGTIETHTSRLLAFGTPGGDSAMAATVGYTTAAAAELILTNGLANTNIRGVCIPTDRRIYEPILKRIQECGVTWTDSMSVSKKGEEPK